MDAIGKPMYIDRNHQVTMSREPAGTASPSSAFGLVSVSISGTMEGIACFTWHENLLIEQIIQ
jgi:hypothetical protein